jgi:hypothetical protein
VDTFPELRNVERVWAPKPPPPGAFCPPPDGTRPDPTLVNVDPFVLRRFPLERVYTQLTTLGGGAPTPLDLYQQMWDALDDNAHAKFSAPHCDDASPPSINGFPIDCPRPETVLKNTKPSSFVPVALFNRFDLAPADGGHCGEYRIVYAMRSGASGRNFIIFEGILPNPNPRCGLEACRPVVDFWESLASLDPATSTGAAALANGLEQFYFKGLPGFEPVVHPGHYGAKGGGGYGANGAGQIRTNMFVGGFEWQLREFNLVTVCPTMGSCKLVLQPVTVKTNPFHEMFNVLEPAPDPRASTFQSVFPAQSGPLAEDDLNRLGMNISNRFNAGQSSSQDFAEHYEQQLLMGSPPNAFSAAIDTELAAIGRSDLDAADVARRATTQSCGGCHELSNGEFLGGSVNPRWPSSRGFVHVDESSFLSEALWCTFLPFRKSVLDGFAGSKPRLCTDAVKQLSPLVVAEREITLPRIPLKELSVAGKALAPN